MADYSHRDLCRLAASWLLQSRRAYLAGYEVGVPVGQLDAVGVTCPPDPELQAVAEEQQAAHREAVKAAWADWHARWEAWSDGGEVGPRPTRYDPPAPAPVTYGSPLKRPRVTILEVKRTRSDLLADLRARKMLGYEPLASECYLACTPPCLGLPKLNPTKESRAAALADLEALGLPGSWGVMLLPERPPHWQGHATVIRPPRRLREVPDHEVRMWAYRIGRSLAWRAAAHEGPMVQEVALDRDAWGPPDPSDSADDDTDGDGLSDDTPEGCHGVRCNDCDDPNCPSNPENGAGKP